MSTKLLYYDAFAQQWLSSTSLNIYKGEEFFVLIYNDSQL